MSRLFPVHEVPGAGDGLNAQQRAAVTHGEGPLLVVAGAGTGKTRVIITRIRHLLKTQPELAGENILGLTYTEKAANEMKARVVAEAGERARAVTLSTFHAFCNMMLLEQEPAARVLEDVDYWIFLRRNIARLELKHFLKLANPGRFLSDFLKFFSRCQDELVTPADYQRYVERMAAQYESVKNELDAEARADRETQIAQQREVARAYAVSEALLRERNYRTFGGMLLNGVRELRTNRALLEKMLERFRYILVDEFQDTNIAQIELLELLAGDRRNIVAVGDDDQAIYRFRGASFGSFQLFAEKFIGAKIQPEKPPKQVVLLSQNYRSTQRILRVAGQCIAMNRDRMFPAKRLETGHGEGEKIRVVELGSPEEEAHWIARDIERRHAEGRDWREFAVLYRIHGHRPELIDALVARKIPFLIRNRTILENALVRDVIAHLRLIGEPNDDVACARVLAIPFWGLGPSDLVRLAERASKSRGMSLWDALTQAQGELPFAKSAARTGELLDWITSLAKRRRRLTVLELLDQLTAAMGLTMMPGGVYRRALDRFREFVAEWEKKSETRTQRLEEFLEYFDFFPEAGGQINFEEEDAEDAVRLMTAHAAKGLEFPHVYVMRLVARSFPTKERVPLLEFPPELMKEELPQGDFHVQEERRLFYVALTRAKKSLTLTTVVHKWSKQSPFLDDVLLDPRLKQADVQQLSPQVARPAVPAAGATPDAIRTELFGPQEISVRAFSRIGVWARNYRPPLYDPLQLSASAVDTYQTCPQKFLFDQQWRLRGGAQATLTFGSVMHNSIKAVVALVEKKRRVTQEDVEAIYLREWRSAGFRDKFQEDVYRQAGLEQLRAFFETYSQAPAEVFAQERRFELPMDHNVVVEGRIDQINTVNDGAVEIVDYKTGTPRTETDAKKSLQLSIYALAAREVLDKEPSRLKFYNLTSNDSVETVRSARDLDKAREKIQEVAADLRAGNFPAQPGFVCNYCEFRPICPEHEK